MARDRQAEAGSPPVRGTPVTGLVWRVSMRWRAAIDRAIAPLGITHAQYAIVVPLLRMDRPTQKQLADFTGLEPLYVSKLARGLEAAGLLERSTHPADSRAVQLALTERGREVTEHAARRVLALQDELLAPLGGAASARSRALADALTILLDPPGGTP
jgi:MarR family transcriptional regulator, organic hydroperoxide resistance regulator